tara:strand:- start:68280 stop:68426 length:147 start_codon:yes stop_codon:yes gene_type:complete
MSPHFCRVGQIKPNLDKLINLKNPENNHVKFIEVVLKASPKKDLHGNF